MTSVALPRFSLTGILADGAQLIAMVFFIPFAILAIGAPFAAAIAGLLWLARLVRAAL